MSRSNTTVKDHGTANDRDFPIERMAIVARAQGPSTR